MDENFIPIDVDYNGYLSWEGRKVAEEQADAQQETIFCKLDGGCLDPEAEDEKLLVKLGIEPKEHVYSAVEEEFLNVDNSGIDFLGEPIYRITPLICIQQLNNRIGSNNLLYWSVLGKFESTFTIDIKSTRLDGVPDRNTLLKVESLCYDIEKLLKPKDGDKKE